MCACNSNYTGGCGCGSSHFDNADGKGKENLKNIVGKSGGILQKGMDILGGLKGGGNNNAAPAPTPTPGPVDNTKLYIAGAVALVVVVVVVIYFKTK